MNCSYSSTDFIGAVVFYLTKADVLKVPVDRLAEVRSLFMFELSKKGKDCFIYCERADIIKFAEEHSNIRFDYANERLVISSDYDFAVMTDCKKYVKKFKQTGEWPVLKNILKAA